MSQKTKKNKVVAMDRYGANVTDVSPLMQRLSRRHSYDNLKDNKSKESEHNATFR